MTSFPNGTEIGSAKMIALMHDMKEVCALSGRVALSVFDDFWTQLVTTSDIFRHFITVSFLVQTAAYINLEQTNHIIVFSAEVCTPQG